MTIPSHRARNVLLRSVRQTRVQDLVAREQNENSQFAHKSCGVDSTGQTYAGVVGNCE